MSTPSSPVPQRRFRALFFGSPAFAVPSLDALHAIADVVAVVCQPDKPAGRGLELTPPAVKVRASELALPVQQPTKLRTGEFGGWARKQNADVAVVVAYGRILPRDVLDAPALGCVNVHASLLPKYRGAAPITWAIVHGETETGVTLMKLDEGMDTGDMLDAQRYFNRALAIKPNMPEALLQLGNLAYSRGDYQPSLDYVLKYLAVNPASPEVLWLGFRAERKLGDNTAAAGYGRRIQTEFPNSEQAQLMRSGVDR